MFVYIQLTPTPMHRPRALTHTHATAQTGVIYGRLNLSRNRLYPLFSARPRIEKPGSRLAR